MKIKRITITFLSLILFICAPYFAVASGETEVQQIQILTDDNYNEISNKEITLKWKVIDNDLNVIVTAPTKGWISVGFDPLKKMKDANIIIGYVNDGKVYTRDDYGVSGISHKPDTEIGGQDNLKDVSGLETDNGTEIRFTIPLNSGDSKDKALVKGKQYKVILAYGRKDNFSSYHKSRTSVTITL